MWVQDLMRRICNHDWRDRRGSTSSSFESGRRVFCRGLLALQLRNFKNPRKPHTYFFEDCYLSSQPPSMYCVARFMAMISLQHLGLSLALVPSQSHLCSSFHLGVKRFLFIRFCIRSRECDLSRQRSLFCAPGLPPCYTNDERANIRPAQEIG